MDALTLVNTGLAGFFACAAIHYATLWWFSRKERVLLVFSIQCLMYTAFCVAITLFFRARTIRDSQVALVSSRLALVVAGSTAMTASDDDFVELFDRALDMPGVADWPMERARLNLIYGERLRRHRAITKARSHLKTAVQDFAVIGAPTWRARSQAELDATGQRNRDGSGVGALTPQEFQVARLAAIGLTNKAIAERLAISHRTVGAHLERSMPKLGVNSRAGLRKAIEGLSDAPSGGAR